MKKRWLGAVLTLGFAVACLLAAGCHRDRTTVPQVLLGVWTSGSPGYSDRYIEIRPDTIIFGTGGTNSRRYRILGCERSKTREGLLYTLEFVGTSTGPFRRPLYYLPEGRGRLRFKNEPTVIWDRSS